MSEDEKGRAPEGAAPDPMAADGFAQVNHPPLLPPSGPSAARDLPDHPLGDPERAWRDPSRILRAVMANGWQAEDGPELLRLLDAAGLLDSFVRCAEWVVATHPDPATRAFGWRMAEAGEAVRRGDKDADGRSVPLGRMLGIQPAAPTSAARTLDRKVRNSLLRTARSAVPAWRDAEARRAALMMIQSFERYAAGPWLEDRKREAAPAAEPAASWWRIMRLGLKIKVPAADHLASILDTEI